MYFVQFLLYQFFYGHSPYSYFLCLLLKVHVQCTSIQYNYFLESDFIYKVLLNEMQFVKYCVLVFFNITSVKSKNNVNCKYM